MDQNPRNGSKSKKQIKIQEMDQNPKMVRNPKMDKNPKLLEF